VPEGEGEGHAIGFVHKRIMKDVVPIVPVCINTYYPPNQPTPRRCYKLGQAIRAAVESYPGDKRVGIIGSGGLSHFVVDEALDRGFIDMLRARMPPRSRPCRARSSIPAAPRSATGSASPARSSISRSNGRSTSPATAPRPAPAPGSALPSGRKRIWRHESQGQRRSGPGRAGHRHGQNDAAVLDSGGDVVGTEATARRCG
jgi:hypothetical protein